MRHFLSRLGRSVVLAGLLAVSPALSSGAEEPSIVETYRLNPLGMFGGLLTDRVASFDAQHEFCEGIRLDFRSRVIEVLDRSRNPRENDISSFVEAYDATYDSKLGTLKGQESRRANICAASSWPGAYLRGNTEMSQWLNAVYAELSASA